MDKKSKSLKKYMIAVAVLFASHHITAQNGNVGINTTSPSATLHVKGKGNTTATQSFKLENSDGTNLFSINDDGTVAGTVVSNLGGSGSGTNGKNALVKTTSETAGSNCPNGGVKVESGVDNNNNGVLDSSEVSATKYVCNGMDGTGFGNGTAGGQVFLTGTSAPFAPQNAQTVTGDVTISSNAVTAIVTNAVTTSKINDGAITSDKIGAQAVTTAKLADASVTAGKISATGTPGAATYLRGDGKWETPPTGTALPSQSGNSGKFLTTDGSNLSWGTASASSGSISYEVFATIAVSQTGNPGSSLTLPSGVAFSSNTSPAVLTGGNTWTLVNDPTTSSNGISNDASINGKLSKFTAGTAGLYFIDIQLISNVAPGAPMLDYNGLGYTDNSYYGTGVNHQQTASTGYKQRGSLQRLVYMNAGDFFYTRALATSTAIGPDLAVSKMTYIKIIKIK